jgi:uncharacterized radical SAM superfamily Fe-S cluster-containing enzyme
MELCIETGESQFNHRLVQQGRAPISMSLEVTERCNLNCQHCYINLPANGPGRPPTRTHHRRMQAPV